MMSDTSVREKWVGVCRPVFSLIPTVGYVTMERMAGRTYYSAWFSEPFFAHGRWQSFDGIVCPLRLQAPEGLESESSLVTRSDADDAKSKESSND